MARPAARLGRMDPPPDPSPPAARLAAIHDPVLAGEDALPRLEDRPGRASTRASAWPRAAPRAKLPPTLQETATSQGGSCAPQGSQATTRTRQHCADQNSVQGLAEKLKQAIASNQQPTSATLGHLEDARAGLSMSTKDTGLRHRGNCPLAISAHQARNYATGTRRENP